MHGIVTDSVAAGASLVTGGTHEGLFYKPTVPGGVATDTRVFQEEIFGPVAPVTIARSVRSSPILDGRGRARGCAASAPNLWSRGVLLNDVPRCA